MATTHGFELIESRDIKEIDGTASYFKHKKSGARFLSISNNDENKVFGINFRTPPKSSNGIAHIMEHSVLCGSRKYPVKEPFVELIKGSLNTFLNAFTYPDKTCYPVASTNLQDFYNLVDVYLDAVFYPRITEDILRQEGWHYELKDVNDPLIYKGVVFNEMKGAYSSSSRVVAELSQHSLFPDTLYSVESGGHPEAIPDLTFEEFRAFHKTYYHPANSYIYFYGDDDLDERMRILNAYLDDFEDIKVDSGIATQKRLSQPVKKVHKYFIGKNLEDDQKGAITINYLLSDSLRPFDRLQLIVLDHVLVGTPASPLRKALIDSGLGADLSGHGLDTDLRQMYFSIGLRGINPADGDKVESLVYTTLEKLAKEGISKETIEASINTIEFSIRENNTGSYPRGLSMMLDALSTWLHDENPLDSLEYEAVLAELKKNIVENPRFFESLIEVEFLQNQHRTTLVFEPDESLDEQRQEREKNKLQQIKDSLDAPTLESIIKITGELQEKQNTPDRPEDLAKIPRLGLEDLDPDHKSLPLEIKSTQNTEIIYHDLFTNGIFYIELGFNLHTAPQEMLPWIRVFGRVLLETGTAQYDQIELTQRIGKYTGGVWRSTLNSTMEDGKSTTAWLFIKGKAMVHQVDELLHILRDILLSARVDNRERIRQIVRDARSSFENGIPTNGHALAQGQLIASYSESGCVSDKLSGLSYLFFLRDLEKRIENDWQSVQLELEKLLTLLISNTNMICNCTIDADNWLEIEPRIQGFIKSLPAHENSHMDWRFQMDSSHLGLSIPSQINFVGKGINLYQHGYQFSGSAFVISNYLRTSWLWDKVRVHGGAYGAFCRFNRRTGVVTFLSYRDPNMLETLDIYDKTAEFLLKTQISEEELVKSIIGTIGDVDAYMLADAKGSTSLFRYLTNTSDATLQQIRNEILQTNQRDFTQFAEALSDLRDNGRVAIAGAEEALKAANESPRGEWLSITKVL